MGAKDDNTERDEAIEWVPPTLRAGSTDMSLDDAEQLADDPNDCTDPERLRDAYELLADDIGAEGAESAAESWRYETVRHERMSRLTARLADVAR